MPTLNLSDQDLANQWQRTVRMHRSRRRPRWRVWLAKVLRRLTIKIDP